MDMRTPKSSIFRTGQLTQASSWSYSFPASRHLSRCVISGLLASVFATHAGNLRAATAPTLMRKQCSELARPAQNSSISLFVKCFRFSKLNKYITKQNIIGDTNWAPQQLFSLDKRDEQDHQQYKKSKTSIRGGKERKGQQISQKASATRSMKGAPQLVRPSPSQLGNPAAVRASKPELAPQPLYPAERAVEGPSQEGLGGKDELKTIQNN